jgi:DNA-binding transcriptional MerR regulator
MSDSPTIHSVGTLARLFRVPVHRIQYVIRSRGIPHAGIAGNVRLYDEAAAQWIGSELQRIADDRNRRGAL